MRSNNALKEAVYCSAIEQLLFTRFLAETVILIKQAEETYSAYYSA